MQKIVFGNFCIDKGACRTEIRSLNRTDSVDGTVVHPMSHTVDNAEKAQGHRTSRLSDSYDADPKLRNHYRWLNPNVGEGELPAWALQPSLSDTKINSLADLLKLVRTGSYF